MSCYFCFVVLHLGPQYCSVNGSVYFACLTVFSNISAGTGYVLRRCRPECNVMLLSE